MKLYIDVKEMTFDEDGIEREIILRIKNTEFLHYDYMIELPDDDIFIQDTMEVDSDATLFRVREQNTWWSLPLYQIVDGKIESFDYTQYQYFTDTDRRMAFAKKIGKLYNPSSEAKIIRKTLKHIMDTLNMEYPDNFRIFNEKVERLIEKSPK